MHQLLFRYHILTSPMRLREDKLASQASLLQLHNLCLRYPHIAVTLAEEQASAICEQRAKHYMEDIRTKL